MKAIFIAASLSLASCSAADEGGRSENAGKHKGPVAVIGQVPEGTFLFSSSDCDVYGFADCGAKDGQGRIYAIFDGAVTRISLTREDAKRGAVLPAGMVFGESLQLSRKKAQDHYGVELECGEVEKRQVCSSGFSIRSPVGEIYSLSIADDGRNGLDEVVERIDF